MLQPVLPPESIKNPVESKQVPSAVPHVVPQQTTPGTSVELQKLVASENKVSIKPESFPPEFSPLSAVKNAAPLGDNLQIGYPLLGQPAGNKQIADTTYNINNTNSANVKQSKELSDNTTQPVSEKPREKPVSNSQQPNSEKVEIIPVLKFQDTNAPNSNNSEQIQNVIEFKSRNPTSESAPPANFVQQAPAPTEQTPEPSLNIPPTPTSPSPTPNSPLPTPPPRTRRRIIEIRSDRQVYDQKRQVVTAEGNVEVLFDGAVVNADRLQVSLDNLISVGDGNVVVTRGDQILRGERFTYNFIQDNGEIANGRGEVFIPSAGEDFSFLPTDISGGGLQRQPLSERVNRNQPVSNVGSPGGINITVGGGRDVRNLPGQVGAAGGEVRRVRFEAQTIEFFPRGWQARNVRLTNDPFSPPELELRADKVTVREVSPLESRVQTQRQRLVFDQGLTLPIPIDSQRISRDRRNVTPFPVSFGYDGDKRGGLFIERTFEPFSNDRISWTLTPQFYAQKAIQGSDAFTSLFGLKSKITGALSDRTSIEGNGELTNLDLSKFEDSFRANLRLRQALGDIRTPHTLNVEYTYRDRFFNGSLGFQEVQSSFGAVVTSPIIPLGNSGLNLSYQGGAQYINANTDRPQLLALNRTNNRVTLGRLQGSAAVSGGIMLWQGKPLAATPTEGLRYTPSPVVPFLQAIGGVTATNSYYTNGDNQSTLTGTIGLQGQIGNFSRPFFDYTGFNISYSQGLNTGSSPFLFDRSVDNRVLNAGITQQIYGPFRVGIQTAINLDTGAQSSTDYTLEYSRRSYGVTLRYNPILELGAISFRLSDFNWSGGTDPFSDPFEVKPVVGGVRQGY